MQTALPPDLRDALDDAWCYLQQGLRDTKSRLRTPVLATVDAECRPHARTVVVERIEPAARRLYVNTDRRSPKFDEIRFRPEAVFVFYDGDTQIRLRARLEVHCDDDVAHQSWASLPADMRAL